MPGSSMSAGDPWPYYNREKELVDNQFFSNPIWLDDITKRLDNLEKIMDRLDKEEKIREKNPFVQELYDQYKVALALLEDPDE